MLTRHIRESLQGTPGPFPDFLGGAWGRGYVVGGGGGGGRGGERCLYVKGNMFVTTFPTKTFSDMIFPLHTASCS